MLIQLQQSSGNFFPRTLLDWLTAFALVGGWIVSAVVFWNKLIQKINGVGDRVAILESSSAEKKGRMDRMENEIADFRRAVTTGSQQLGGFSAQITGVQDHITGLELRIMGEFGRIKDLINDKDVSVRERVARLETFHAELK